MSGPAREPSTAAPRGTGAAPPPPPGMPRRKRSASEASLPSAGEGSGDVEHANSDLAPDLPTRYTHGQQRNYKRCWFCLHATDPTVTEDASGLCDGYELDIITTVQTFWNQHSLTVDVDELSAMSLELFQRRAAEFATEEGVEVR